jgi:peptidoglycan/xylan/chitin deacetylase (PgdA/CDA1 family)
VFETTQPFAFFDYVRTPYRVGAASPLDGFACARRGDRALYWPDAPGDLSSTQFGALVRAERMRDRLPSTWRPLADLHELDGAVAGSVWTDGESIALPFDPSAAIEAYWTESYGAASASGLKRAAMRAYYRVRPALPRRVQIALRRGFTRIQARAQFPRWPVEPGLHDLYALLFDWAAHVAGEPVPWIAPWPRDYSWALVLTHDVEQELGYRSLHLLRDIERELGYRSSWNFVPRRSYRVEESVVEELTADGFEVGVHGLYHDGRDLESLETFQERLPEMQEYGRRWGAVGFRSPATHRSADLMPLLGFDYDSSYPDTDPFEPQAGGCCSWLPYFLGDVVELPITLTQDYTAFVLLRRPDESLWVEKTEVLRERGGLALLITHPDYMLDEPLLEAYRRFLARYRDDAEVWKPLPREVSAWWRRRAASTIERDGGGWRIAGPAADEGRVLLGA